MVIDLLFFVVMGFLVFGVIMLERESKKTEIPVFNLVAFGIVWLIPLWVVMYMKLNFY